MLRVGIVLAVLILAVVAMLIVKPAFRLNVQHATQDMDYVDHHASNAVLHALHALLIVPHAVTQLALLAIQDTT